MVTVKVVTVVVVTFVVVVAVTVVGVIVVIVEVVVVCGHAPSPGLQSWAPLQAFPFWTCC